MIYKLYLHPEARGEVERIENGIVWRSRPITRP